VGEQDGIYRYCHYTKLDAAVDLGWVLDNSLPGPHQHWSYLVRWGGPETDEDKLPWPANTEAKTRGQTQLVNRSAE
jgi:hypothetical protein